MSLVVHNVSKEYATRGAPLSILRSVSQTFPPASATAITGPSGSGKSTLLHILGTLDRPTAGTVELTGLNPFTLTEAKLAEFRSSRIGFVFQDHHLLPQCHVLENVLIPTLITPEAGSERIRKRAIDLIDRVGLSDRLLHRPAELSGGERQRVAVARALIHSPGLLLADEPTGNLDRHSATVIGDLLIDLCKHTGAILIVVTHSLDLAAKFPTRLAMDDGRLVS
jgi:lipoprotein-releasing system ATP-binding protein